MNSTATPDDSFWTALQEAGGYEDELIQNLRHKVKARGWKPLGAILIRSGFMTVRQVAGLLSMQADEPEMRIGDLAVREGYCTPEHIQQALQQQREGNSGPVDVLLEDERVDDVHLMQALKAYVGHLEGRISMLSKELDDWRGVLG